MSAADGHPLPWSAGRRGGTDTFALTHEGDETREWVAVWDVNDADGNRVATIVEPVRDDQPADRPLPTPRRPGPQIGNGRGVRETGLRPHWCHDDSDSVVEFIGCVCTTGVDHWSDQMDRPDLADSDTPKPITGAPVVLDFANREHERREHVRTHPSVNLALDFPGVMVNVPGMHPTMYGGDGDGRSPDLVARVRGTARMLPDHSSRLFLTIARAMLLDAVAIIDRQVADMDRVVDRIPGEAVVLAVARLREQIDRQRGHTADLDVIDVRTLLRDVADRTPATEA